MTQANEFNFELLVSLTGKLTSLINKESASLKIMKISEIAGVQAEKNAVAAELEQQQSFLRENLEVRASLTIEQKTILKQAAIEFDAAIQTYQEELFKAKKVNEMIIGKMVEIVKDHVIKNRSYGRNGSQDLSGTELAKNTPALKYNAQA